MCQGNINEDWYCCRPFLIDVLTNPGNKDSMDLIRFLGAGHRNTVMKTFDGRPPARPKPRVVIQVLKEAKGDDSFEVLTDFYFFAFDEESSAWYELGDERWIGLRRYTMLDDVASAFQKNCSDHNVEHSFIIWRLRESRDNSPVAGPPSHRGRRLAERQLRSR